MKAAQTSQLCTGTCCWAFLLAYAGTVPPEQDPGPARPRLHYTTGGLCNANHSPHPMRTVFAKLKREEGCLSSRHTFENRA